MPASSPGSAIGDSAPVAPSGSPASVIARPPSRSSYPSAVNRVTLTQTTPSATFAPRRYAIDVSPLACGGPTGRSVGSATGGRLGGAPLKPPGRGWSEGGEEGVGGGVGVGGTGDDLLGQRVEGIVPVQ